MPFGGPTAISGTSCCAAGGNGTLGVDVHAQCEFFGRPGGATIRYQGPGGIDVTRTLGCTTYSDSYAQAPAGTWTITVSHPSCRTQTATATVTANTTTTTTVRLSLRFSTVHYSDDYGSVDLAIPDSILCNADSIYKYTSSHAAVPTACGTTTLWLRDHSATVAVKIRLAAMSINDCNLGIQLARYVAFDSFPVDCDGNTPGWALIADPTNIQPSQVATVIVTLDPGASGWSGAIPSGYPDIDVEFSVMATVTFS